jgi:predicted transcriptional regulator
MAERRGDEAQFLVLALLLRPGGPALWSVAELARELGCELATAEAVVRLHAAGLVHRREEFVWPTRAASRFCQLLRE